MKKGIKNTMMLLLLLWSSAMFSQEVLTLQECVDKAIKHSKQLKMAENNIEKATYQRKEILSNLWPKINGTVDYKYYFDLPTQLMPAKAFNPMAPEWQFKPAQFGVPHNINANVQVGMPLFNPDLISGLKISKVAIELQELNYQKSKEDTYVLISNLYYNAQIIKNQIEFTEKNINNLNKLLQDLKLFYEQKMVTKNDVDKVALQVSKLDVNLKMLHQKYDEIRNALKLNMGVSNDFEVSSNIINPEPKTYMPKSNTNELLLEKKIELSDNEIKKLKRSRLPRLSAFGSYGSIGYGYDEKPHDFLDFYDVSLVGVKLEIPVFDFSKRRQIQQKKIDKENARLQLDLVKEKNAMDIKNARQKLAVQLQIIQNQKEQMALAKSVYDKTLLQHKQELVSLSDVLLAENEMIKAQQDYLSSIVTYLKTDLELKKLTGNLVPKN